MRRLTLRSSPASLANIKPAPDRPRVRLAALHIHEALLGLDDRSWLALIVYTQDFAPDLEFAALGAYGQGFEELELALAIEDASGVELRDTFDWLAVAPCVEVDDILVGVLEGKDDGVGREGSEGWVEFLGICQVRFARRQKAQWYRYTYVEEVQLIRV
jgi:hypothetical protein